MWKFLKDFFVGEPVVSTTIISTGLTATLAGLADPPMWLEIATPIWVAAAGFYARDKVNPEQTFRSRRSQG